ncbi:MAG: hypothetical protein Q8J80_04690 [Gallionella sp.]|nr:hypothetical protein [Gallionella sp.]
MLLLSFLAALLGATKANAAACTSVATGNWNAATTWAAPCNVAGGPVAADTVTIAAAHTVTVTANAAATGIIVAAPSVATHGVNINPGVTLSVSGAITMAASTGTNRSSTIAVGTGTLNAGSIAISGGNSASRFSQVTVGATGTVNVTGAVTSGGTAAQSRFVATGASNITVGGNFAPGAFTPGGSTVTVSGSFIPTAMVAGTGTVVFAGGAGQTMGAFTTYNNVTINKTAGTAVSLLGTTTIGGALNVNSGTHTVGAFALTVTGATNVGGTLNITSATGAKTFTGLVTINPGGIWSNATAAVALRGGLSHNGATFTAGTGVYTFSTTAAQSLNCATALTIPRLTVTAPTVLTNNCNLTVSTALAGTGNLTNSTGSTLTLGGTSAITALTATAVGNTVNYTGAAQTVKATPYSNLGLAGSGAKTLTGVTTIGGNLTMSGTATATAAAALTVSGNFSIGATNTFGNGANALNVAGNFQQNGTFTAGTGVVTLNGGAAVQTISGAGVLGFANLTVSNTGGITLARNVTVTSAIVGTVTLTSTCPTDYTLTSNGGATVKHSCSSPTVVSVNYASINPTTSATVSWTVTFNTSVTGVSSSNFTLVNTGLGGAPAITGVTGSGTAWTVTASTGSGTGTLGLNMANVTGISPAIITTMPFTGQVYSVRPALPKTYYHDTTLGVPIGFDGTTNVTSGTNQTIPPIITASLITANTCTGNARSANHPVGLYTHSRWYLNANYAANTNIAANPTGSAFLRGNAATDKVTVSLYDYDPVAGGKTLIGSSAVITLTGAGTTTAYPYTIASAAYTVPAGHRLMLQYDFNQPGATNNARVYCSATSAFLTVTETLASAVNCTSVASGNWSAAATWTSCRGGIPLSGDFVTVDVGHTVTQNINTPAISDLSIDGILNNAANTLTVAGNISVNAGGTYSGGSGAAAIAGDFSNAGTFTSGSGTWTFNGTAAQSFTGTATFQNLTLNNASGFTLNGAVTASGVLALTSGTVATGANILTAAANCPASVVRTSGFVDGNLRLTFPSGTTTCTYPVGSNGNYSPIAINLVTTLLGGGTLTGSTTGNEHPLISNSGIDSALDVNRYWSLWASGDTVDVGSYGVTFGFVAGEVDALATPGNFAIGKYVAGTWTRPTPVTPGATSTGVSNVSGPIAATTSFVAGETAFACSVPAGSPAGVTCVCDNFNRASLNPSTIYSGNWNVSTSGLTAFLPQIVANKLRLTSIANNVSTSATSPGTFPAKGNWISVEFKHYAYGGTGGDGITFILSDAAIAAVSGAYGGSLGYAQKTGINGFTGGWIGIGVDEYGNFSANTEGRVGGAAPGLTADSVSARGSGSGVIGYPYLGGTATLTPPIDAPSPATAGLGHAYRLTVDARNYSWNGSAGTKTTLVSIERDSSGTGASYTPLIPSFDAYAVNPLQAEVPTNWQLSFTGSSGASTNIHEISGLKICAQTYVPPAGFRIVADNLTPTTCASDPRPTVTISALNTNGQVSTTYAKTVVITATLQGGAASSATLTSAASNNGIWDSVNKRYTFAAADNGTANFVLSDAVQEGVYINVSEYLGTINSSSGTPVQFSSGVASFVVDTPAADALGAGVIAGRPHLMSVKRNASVCGGGTDTTFIGVKPMDGWYTPTALGAEHPIGAAAPKICLPVSGACLPNYGACQTLSIAAPVASATSNNLNLTFSAGVASFCLVTSDVGKYSLSLRDDATVPAAPVTGTSAILTARPFAVIVSDVMQGASANPADDTSDGAIFANAGANFQTNVGGYLWNSSGDLDGNGLPEIDATYEQLTGSGIAAHYADTVLLLAAAPFSPAAGLLSNGAVAVPGGGSAAATTWSTLNYSEAGTFTLTATAATNYLNSTGVNLTDRVAIFAGSANARTALIGRFIPDHFNTSVVLSAGVPMPCPNGLTCPASNDVVDGFVYSGQPFSVRVTALNALGGVTANYATANGYAKTVTLEAWDGRGSETMQNPGGNEFSLTYDPLTFVAGVATVAPTYTLSSALTAPTDAYVRAYDVEDVFSLRLVPADSLEGGVKVASGRIKLSNAHGSELLKLPLTATVQYFNGTFWVTSAMDSLTSLTLAATYDLLNKSGAITGTTTPTPTGAATVTNGILNISLSRPTGGAGSAMIVPTVPTYLPLTGGRATFGVYKGNNEFIYLRENY